MEFSGPEVSAYGFRFFFNPNANPDGLKDEALAAYTLQHIALKDDRLFLDLLKMQISEGVDRLQTAGLVPDLDPDDKTEDGRQRIPIALAMYHPYDDINVPLVAYASVGDTFCCMAVFAGRIPVPEGACADMQSPESFDGPDETKGMEQCVDIRGIADAISDHPHLLAATIACINKLQEPYSIEAAPLREQLLSIATMKMLLSNIESDGPAESNPKELLEGLINYLTQAAAAVSAEELPGMVTENLPAINAPSSTKIQ